MVRMGMDVDAVEQASRALKSRSNDLGAIIAAVDQIVRQLPSAWQGQDSADFVNNSWPKHKAALTKLRTDVEGLGQSAWNNAQEQRQVSGGGELAVAGVAASAAATAVAALGSGSSGQPSEPSAANTSMSSTASGSSSPGELSHWNEASYRSFELQKHWYAAGGYYVDANGKAVDNCTAWAAWRREELGLSAPHGNGFEMAGNAGGTRDTPPSLGAIVSDTYNSQAGGHVMIIEKINTDGSFVVSETNYAGSSAIHMRTWHPTADGQWRSDGGAVRDLIIAK